MDTVTVSSQDVMAVREITWVVFSLAQGRLFWGSTSSLQIYKRMLQRGRNKFYFVQEEMVVRKNWTLKGKKNQPSSFLTILAVKSWNRLSPLWLEAFKNRNGTIYSWFCLGASSPAESLPSPTFYSSTVSLLTKTIPILLIIGKWWNRCGIAVILGLYTQEFLLQLVWLSISKWDRKYFRQAVWSSSGL